MKSADVRAAISVAYKQPEWATFFEVADGTGARKTRSADAISVNMYPSRGLTINGFEIKVDRSDWRRELADPSKAEAIAQYCDFWWVAAPKGLVDPTTLPTTWGLTEVDEKGGLRIKVQAKQLQPKPVTKQFFAALCRAKACADESVVKAAVEVELRKALGDRETQVARMVRDRTVQAEQVLKQHAAFANAMGRFGKLSHMREDDILKGLQMLEDLGILGGWGPLRNLMSAARGAANTIDRIEKEYFPKEEK